MFVVEVRYQPTCVCIYDQNVCVCSLPLDYLLHIPTWDILSSAALWYRQGYPSLLPPLHQPGSKDKPGTTPVLCFYHRYTHTHTYNSLCEERNFTTLADYFPFAVLLTWYLRLRCVLFCWFPKFHSCVFFFNLKPLLIIQGLIVFNCL